MIYARYDLTTGVIFGIFEATNIDNVLRNVHDNEALIEASHLVDDRDYKVIGGAIVYDQQPIDIVV